MKRIFSVILSIGIVLLCSCQQPDPSDVEKETVEGFILETLDGTDGYKKVNSITNMKENKHVLAARVRVIEDYYDSNGDYIKTEILHTFSKKNKMLQTIDGDDTREEVSGPLTIHLPDGVSSYSTSKLNEQQLEEIKKLVLEITKDL